MKFLFPILFILNAYTTIAYALSPEEKGKSIAIEFDQRDLGYGDYQAEMEMVLVNKQGEKNIRQLQARTIEVEKAGESERRLLVFDKPHDVRGTVLLTASNKNRSDDQWLYFPAIKRVKRISTSNRSGPFMGSEFSYEDFSSPEVEKYTYKYIKDESCGELNCYVFERYPKQSNSGYSKQILWVDQQEYRLWQVHFYDRKQSLIKTLKLGDYQQYLNKYWRAGTMKMDNVQSGKQTILHWKNYRFSVGFKLSEFQPARLQNVH